MRRFTFLIMAMLCLSSISAPRKVLLNGTEYAVDTIMRRQEGPGIMHTRVRVPDYPLNAYVLEMDMTNTYNRVETTQAYNSLGRTELLANAYKRHKEQGKKPIAGCNGSFWCVTGSGEPKNWMLGSPFGGEVVNDTLYLNTNTSADTWNGGPARASSTIIDTDKRVHVGPHQWFGYVKSSKFDAAQEIIQVNKRVDTGQLTLFNHAIGRNHTFYAVADCHYVYLKLKSGERWTTASDITFEVAEVKLNANNQVLGDYDACLVGDGNYKAQLERLAAGDEVTINHYWIALQEEDKSPIKVENMLEGNAWIMLHGEITYRATDETYNTQTYSKCAYGNNKEGNKLYMLVIDMSTHSEYGRSAGCNTTVMANLFKFLCPELWNLTNNDAGGSAQMMVDGVVVNKTTEATPRAVANGMLMFSVAPEEEADVVASLAFDELHIASPTYFSIAPKVLAYNKYGELIADGLEGVTYTCSESVGEPSTDGSKIEVGGKEGQGTITAHYGGVEVTAPIEVVNSAFAIRIKPKILIDNVRTYPLEVTTELNGKQLVCDARRFVWTVGDADVAQIEDGVLRGISEGTTTITAAIDGLSDQTTVTVEVAPTPEIEETFADWTLSSANLSTDAVLDAEGNVSFGYQGAR
ncbi:MAG: phosphodiester glycosidase family protein, partial [Muribaculaceae bacterium]